MTELDALDEQILESEAKVFDLKMQRAQRLGDVAEMHQFKDLMYAKIRAKHAARASREPCFFVEQGRKDAEELVAVSGGCVG